MNAAQNTKTSAKPLSVKAIEALKPGGKVLADTGENTGLRVKCGATGVKSFSYRYTSPETGKLTQIQIGRYPQITLSQARVKLEDLKRLRKQGLCPRAENARIKQQSNAAKQVVLQAASNKAFSVTDLVELYLSGYIEDRYIPDRNNPGEKKKVAGARIPKGQAETRRTLYGDAVEVLGNMPANEVTRKDVVNMIMAIVLRGANVQAGNVLRELSAAYDYGIGLERFDDDFANPALLAKASLNQAKVKLTSEKKTRALTDKELKLVLDWLPGSGFSNTQKNILRFTLWTGCRTGEVCGAMWQDVDLEKGTWHLKETKNNAGRYVQLSTQAIEFLRQLKLNTVIYLFPSLKAGKPILQKSLTETKWQLRNRNKLNNRRKLRDEQVWLDSIDDWTPHDLRRTVRTGLSRLGCPSVVAETVLGHSKKGIEGTYDMHGFEQECKTWLQAWADHMDAL